MAIRAIIVAVFRPPHLISVLIIFLLLGTTPLYGAVEQKKTIDRKQIRECGEMVSRSQCLRNTNCRWCQSDALDDACFSKSESSRNGWEDPPAVQFTANPNTNEEIKEW